MSITAYLRYNWRYLLASFALPLVIMMFIYLSIGIYPGSDRSILASDAFAQFSNFHASFRNMLLGKQSLFYTWSGSLGLNYLSLISYYLGGFFTPLVIFFPNQYMPDALYVITLLKIGSAGLCFWLFANHTFQLNRWNQLILSLCYALMSFAIAHSEIIMWLDTFTFLPLIIWGIHRLIEQQKPRLLFYSYLCLFISNFYMGFMVALFSGMYYLALLFTEWPKSKKSILPYTLSALLASGASLIMVLPAILDLRTNGEEFTKITSWKTEATGVFDFFIKNMVGVYDTTKYGSIPFIYVGLFPLTLAVFFFLTRAISKRQKLSFGAIALLLLISFYFQPFNLFWQGMHAPNMFLFRFAYLLSFLVITLAGFGWERLTKHELPTYLFSILLLLLGFTFAYGAVDKTTHAYLTITSFALTIIFLLVYFVCMSGTSLKLLSRKQLSILLLLTIGVEVSLNANAMVHGILEDWNYASRSLYTDPQPSIQSLVDQTKQASDTFYRLENLDPVSSNDSFAYNYAGINMFSSIRNRHSSTYLNDLGFRSRGTNLNIRYNNNTLLMDAFTGIKYNIASSGFDKFGFKKIAQKGAYTLYQNEYALPLGFTIPETRKEPKIIANDNLQNQTNLINYLSGLDQTYFAFEPIQMIQSNNTTISTVGEQVTYKEITPNVAKELTYEVTIPAHTQAYLSLFPTDFNQLQSSSASITVNGKQRKTQININGQYYDLGYYDQTQTVTFTLSLYGTDQVTFQTPKVITLNTDAYTQAIEEIKTDGVAFKTGNRSAKATVTADEAKTLVTTIPYDKGWSATLDGKKVAVTEFEDGLISLKIPKGEHKIVLRYFPPGLKMGIFFFISCLLLFFFYQRYLQKTTK